MATQEFRLLLILAGLFSFGLPQHVRGEIVAGPYLQYMTDGSVQLIYEGAAENGNGFIVYGETPADSAFQIVKKSSPTKSSTMDIRTFSSIQAISSTMVENTGTGGSSSPLKRAS